MSAEGAEVPMTDRDTLAALVKRAGGNPWFAADLILDWLDTRP